MKKKPLVLLQEHLSYSFENIALLQQALTHRSYVNESREKTAKDNERLEFLGDAVLDLIICQALMERFPKSPEGDLSKMKAEIVNEQSLAKISKEFDLGTFLFLGKGEKRTQGSEKPSLLANAFEALIAAIYLDKGLESVRRVILKHFQKALTCLTPGEISFDYKTALQEYSQKTFGGLPIYRVMNETGPDHQKEFEIETIVNGKPCGIGKGKSKKAAEQTSAGKALIFLKVEGNVH